MRDQMRLNVKSATSGGLNNMSLFEKSNFIGETLDKYKKWKIKHLDEYYQYGHIHDFINIELRSGELQNIFDYVEKHYKLNQ